MKKCALLFFIFCVTSAVFGQVPKERFLSAAAGYGTENDWGNTGFFFRANYDVYLTKRLNLDLSVNRFTTDIYNASKGNPTGFEGQNRKYNAWFVSPALTFKFNKPGALIRTGIKAGPALRYANYVILKTYQERVYNDGHKELVPGTVAYHTKKGFRLGLYNSVYGEVRLSKRFYTGLFVDAYSFIIELEHFLPGISLSYKL